MSINMFWCWLGHGEAKGLLSSACPPDTSLHDTRLSQTVHSGFVEASCVSFSYFVIDTVVHEASCFESGGQWISAATFASTGSRRQTGHRGVRLLKVQLVITVSGEFYHDFPLA